MGTKLEQNLRESGLLGLRPALVKSMEKLRASGLCTVGEISAKFKQEALFPLRVGTLDRFYAGISGLVGPPRMIDGSLLRSMEAEHCSCADSKEKYTTKNGVTTTSATEWEFAL